MRSSRTITLAALAAASLSMQAQFTVVDSLPVSIVAELLEGVGVTIVNVEVDCVGRALGHYTGATSLSVPEGLILTTGKAVEAVGPSSFFASVANLSGSDPDLEILSGQTINDACAIIFDCIPAGDTLLLNYHFASEEYPEYVCTIFNDVFGLFLSGPGILGPFSEGAANVATLPHGSVPVAINTVNSGISGNAGGNPNICAQSDPNWQSNSIYYVNNAGGTQIAYDGYTVQLVAFAVVQPGQVYRFKAAVGDAGDSAFDSAVFLEAFSFRSNAITTSIPTMPAPAIGLEHHGEEVVALLPQGTQGVLQLFGPTGQLLRELRITGDRMPIALGSLGSGMYILRVADRPEMAPVRFVKE